MNLHRHCGHYVGVGLATFFTCVAAWETLQNGFLATHVFSGGWLRRCLSSPRSLRA